MTFLSLVELAALVPTSILLLIILSQYLILFKKRNRFTGDLPPISVLVPAHNEGPYIRQTIKALLGAEYPNRKEIIIIDDGSHRLPHQSLTFNVLWPRVKPGGLYIVEDIQNAESDIPYLSEIIQPTRVLDLRKVKGRYDDILLIWQKER